MLRHLVNSELCRTSTQQRHINKPHNRLWRFAESVDKLVENILAVGLVSYVGNAAVDRKAGGQVLDIILGDVGGDLNIHRALGSILNLFALFLLDRVGKKL